MIAGEGKIIQYCREHCKQTAGCYGVELSKVIMPAQPNWEGDHYVGK